MYTQKLHAGSKFPDITATTLTGEQLKLSDTGPDADWKLVVVYRGKHCPLCTKYLNQLEGYQDKLISLGVETIAVSGDSREQLEQHLAKLNISFPITHGLSIEQMKTLGLYISNPRSPEETDHQFAEPGLFVVNEKGNIQVVDISNNPFVRPELEALVSGIAWIRNPENNYPIRGTYAD
ncbi:redoxin domain-containing protein [Aliikangiella marina]|uniref:Redoxin domain-containing protein n=1 Tax=Aliikangiella marina TaxID=1712262 RepID=A0A545T1P6_9GAMM|nr:redoxin domain-containing protein [Aliikangiella marina]TQV71119.1 redoxin domain-containing protein [Aliikangiella marina]